MLFSRRIHHPQRRKLTPRLLERRWPRRYTFMSAFTQWVGAHCRGYTYPISSRQGRDTMVWRSLPHLSGYGVCPSSFRTSTLLQQYFPRLCRFKSDANHSHKTRLQDVPHVCSPKHWGDGSVLAVRPTFFSCSVPGFFTRLNSILPETKGRSLEEMDIIFGAVSVEARAENIARQGQGACCPSLLHLPPH